MSYPALWDTGRWDDSSWDTVISYLDGAITNGNDSALGGIAVINNVGGLITENPDTVVGSIATINLLSGAVTELADIVEGEILTIAHDTVILSGDITEGEDITSGVISLIYPVFGAITENPDVVVGQINNIVRLSGAILEHADIVRGNIKGPKGQPRPGGGWAPQFYYRRDWEPEPVAEIEQIELELEPEFVPQPLPIDPTVARMIEIMMRGPQVVSTDEDDLESILMNL